MSRADIFSYSTERFTDWYGCPDPDRCEDPECLNPAHLPDRDTTWDGWSDADEDASWVEDDHRAKRREDR